MFQLYSKMVSVLNHADGIPLLVLRLILAPVMIQAGYNKYRYFESTVEWFASMGLPAPELMVYLAATTELVGGVLLVLGLLTRLISIPLLITMYVAATQVHWDNGWGVTADTGSWLHDGTLLYNEQVMASADKLERAKEILQQYGNYDWLTSSGSFTILNNGIEFAVIYFCMLLVLLFYGGGRYFSLDYWFVHTWVKKSSNESNRFIN